MKVLPIALGAGAVYLLASSAFNKAQALKNLTYGNPKIKVKSLSLTNMELEMQLDITNPNTASITLDYFTGIVRYQGAQLTSFTFNANGKNTVIRGRQITTIPFTLLVKNFSAIGAIIKLIDSLAQSKKVSTVLNVTGSLFAAGIDVPVNFDYDIKNNAVVPAVGAFNFSSFKKLKLGKAVKKGAKGFAKKGFKTLKAKAKTGIKKGFTKLKAKATQYMEDQEEQEQTNAPRKPWYMGSIAGVEAKLNFSSNAEMEKYFSNRKAAKQAKVPAFSKN